MGGRGRHDLARFAVAVSRRLSEAGAARHCLLAGQFGQPALRHEGAMVDAGGRRQAGELDGFLLLQDPENHRRETQAAEAAAEAGELEPDDYGLTIRIGGF